MPTAPFTIPLVLEGLAERYPGVRLKLHEGDLDDINRWLASGQIEAALTYDMHLEQSIHFEPLIEAPVHVILSAKHRLAEQEAISLRDSGRSADRRARSSDHAAVLPIIVP